MLLATSSLEEFSNTCVTMLADGISAGVLEKLPECDVSFQVVLAVKGRFTWLKIIMVLRLCDMWLES